MYMYTEESRGSSHTVPDEEDSLSNAKEDLIEKVLQMTTVSEVGQSSALSQGLLIITTCMFCKSF